MSALTYRELWRRYIGKVRHDWTIAAQINAVQYAAAGVKNVDPNDFNPIVKMFRQVSQADIEAGWNIAAQMGRVTQDVGGECTSGPSDRRD